MAERQEAMLRDAVSTQTAQEVLAAARKDPKLRSALNLEPVGASVIVWVGSTGIVATLGRVMTQVGTCAIDLQCYDAAMLSADIGTLGLFAAIVWKRVVGAFAYWRK